MAFKGRGTERIEFKSLITTLTNSKLQVEDYPVYQVIKQLIEKVAQRDIEVSSFIQNFDSTIQQFEVGNLSAILASLFELINQLGDATFLTATDETDFFGNTVLLLAGDAVEFDDTVPNQRTVNVIVDNTTIQVNGSNELEVISAGSAVDFVVMSDGGNPPLPLNDGNGNFIYTPYTP